MNSFRFLERGVRAEIERQTELVEAGEPVVQETLHYDPASDRLTSLRSKEEAHDYRYFPEPDLVPLLVTDEMPGGGAGGDPRAAGARAWRASSASWGWPPAWRATWPSAGSWPTTSSGRWPRRRRAGDPVEVANWIPQLVERIGSDADPAESRVSPGRWRRWRRWSRPRRSAATPPATC